MIKYLKNTKGMSLVELMVVAAIMVIIGLGIATMMQNAYRAQRGIDAKDNQRDAVARIRNLLNNKLACLNTISPGSARNISTVPFTLTQLRDESNVASFAQGVLHESGTLAYDRYEFYAQSTPSASIPTERIINLRLWLNKQGDITGPRAIRTEMKVKARLDASNRIIECIILGEDTESFWQQTPTNQSNIHYSGGNVGILNNNPREALEVTGNILASTYLWTSDARLKNIESKSEGLAALDNINGYKFNWKSDGKSDYGVIAQEVEQQFPELVITQPDGVKTVNYLGLIAPLIESIHELKAEQIKLKKEIEYLKKSQKKHK